MHALSANSSSRKEASTVRFGDYKMAHTLDKSDPCWLHEKEVCVCMRVYVVLYLSHTLSLTHTLTYAHDLFLTPSLSLHITPLKPKKKKKKVTHLPSQNA